MSRNLGETYCAFCGSTTFQVGNVKEITREQAGKYFEEFQGMLVAEAECVPCGAQYLAWVDMRTCVNPRQREAGLHANDSEQFFDLSHRSAFNDEPGDADKPTRTVYLKVTEDEKQRVATLALTALEKANDRIMELEREVQLFKDGVNHGTALSRSAFAIFEDMMKLWDPVAGSWPFQMGDFEKRIRKWMEEA